MKLNRNLLYQLYFEMPQAISKFTMVNADVTTKEHSEQSERMRHLVAKSVLIVFLLIFLISCSTKEEKQENVLYEVRIFEAFQKNEEVNLSEIADGEIEYIQLDSDKDHLLAQNPQLYLSGNEIFAFAKQQIYVFDRSTGKFLREIGHYGNDPGGYKKVLHSFVFDEEKKLIYTGGWDSKSYNRYFTDGSFFDKVTAYSIDKEGDVMKNIFGEMVTSIAPLNDTCFVGYIWNINGKQEAKLIVFNENNHRIKAFPQYKRFDYDINRDGINVFQWNAKYYQLNQQLHFFERFTDTIFTVSLDTLLPKFVLEQGKTENTNATDFTKNQSIVPSSVENIFESKRYLFFEIRVGKNSSESVFLYGFYDKKEKTTSVSSDEAGFKNDSDNFMPFKFISANQNNEIVGYYDAYEVKLWFDENPEKAAKLSLNLQKLKDIIETDNPVVMIAKLKE